ARIVEIRGEVSFPGRYPVRNGETLSSVIARAGGLNNGAFIEGAVFTREMIKEREKLQMNKLAEQLKADVATRALSAEKSLVNPADAIAMVNELQKQEPVGRFVVDLPAIVSGNDSADLEVEHGDILYVPRKNTAITVVGEVQHASSHRFKDGMSLEYYLEQAGGFRKRADESGIYVIRADGSVMLPSSNRWFAVTSEQLTPGDTIVVPLDTEYKDSLSLWTQVTQIFYQSAVALAAISSL
ncbi:SLBB domain-containing protein, partial [Rheinheimera baltica]